MGLADSPIPVCISNIAQKTLHPVLSAFTMMEGFFRTI